MIKKILLFKSLVDILNENVRIQITPYPLDLQGINIWMAENMLTKGKSKINHVK